MMLMKIRLCTMHLSMLIMMIRWSIPPMDLVLQTIHASSPVLPRIVNKSLVLPGASSSSSTPHGGNSGSFQQEPSGTMFRPGQGTIRPEQEHDQQGHGLHTRQHLAEDIIQIHQKNKNSMNDDDDESDERMTKLSLISRAREDLKSIIVAQGEAGSEKQKDTGDLAAVKMQKDTDDLVGNFLSSIGMHSSASTSTSAPGMETVGASEKSSPGRALVAEKSRSLIKDLKRIMVEEGIEGFDYHRSERTMRFLDRFTELGVLMEKELFVLVEEIARFEEQHQVEQDHEHGLLFSAEILKIHALMNTFLAKVKQCRALVMDDINLLLRENQDVLFQQNQNQKELSSGKAEIDDDEVPFLMQFLLEILEEVDELWQKIQRLTQHKMALRHIDTAAKALVITEQHMNTLPLKKQADELKQNLSSLK